MPDSPSPLRHVVRETLGPDCRSVDDVRALLITPEGPLMHGDTIVIPSHVWNTAADGARDALLGECLAYGVRCQVDPSAIGAPWRERCDSL